MSGKCPISNKLLKSFDIEKEIGVAINERNFPDIPQWEIWDFFIFLISFPISKGLVFILAKGATFYNGSRWGAGSSGFGTVDLEAKKVLKILLKEGLLSVELTELLNAFLTLLFAVVESLAACLDFSNDFSFLCNKRVTISGRGLSEFKIFL